MAAWPVRASLQIPWQQVRVPHPHLAFQCISMFFTSSELPGRKNRSFSSAVHIWPGECAKGHWEHHEPSGGKGEGKRQTRIYAIRHGQYTLWSDKTVFQVIPGYSRTVYRYFKKAWGILSTKIRTMKCALLFEATLGAKKWLSGEKYLLVLQKTWVQLPEATRCLSFGGFTTFFWASAGSCMHVVHVKSHRDTSCT